MTRVQTSLWFDGGVDEAAAFYVSLLPDSRILGRLPYVPTENAPGTGRPRASPSPWTSSWPAPATPC